MSLRSKNRYISLFTGAGGLDIGLEASGWKPIICVELDETAKAVAGQNRSDWVFSETGDVNTIARNPGRLLEEAGSRVGDVELVVGGPPCQPFSKAGLWHSGSVAGLKDPRAQTLRSMMAIVRHILPRFVLIENVPGIAKGGANSAISYIERAFGSINRKSSTRYRVNMIELDSADYGAPQHRTRVFVIADREGKSFSAPNPSFGACADLPHRTAWDAIGNLSIGRSELRSLQVTGKWAGLLPSIPEGNNYQWHTEKGGGVPLFGWRTRYWTFLLKLAKRLPSWTIQANPGPATGPFHWANRHLAVRELARIQTFPDNYSFPVAYRQARTLLGNAVPPVVGEALGQRLLETLGRQCASSSSSFLGKPSGGKLRRSPVRPVPKEYISLAGYHEPHPGVGRGPRGKSRNEGQTNGR